MAKQAISVTLDTDNITWLKGRVGSSGIRSVSELLDQIVAAARQDGRAAPSRSVIGTIEIDSGDPMLDKADVEMRALFAASLHRPLAVRERRPAYGARAPKRRRG